MLRHRALLLASPSKENSLTQQAKMLMAALARATDIFFERLLSGILIYHFRRRSASKLGASK